ncbi:hypothetical protein [Streptomyces purpurogeneiscleroticus]|uniref:hypothetical protein n=1 Tax=Streptomyces purpurogeneiscleroticus TaxID=68259 RepID=UPI001CC1708B|nr:hypothetical protein [Streptomyces purpurogeneiscleroticus]MBZ4016627.1 hypothetical protein [Streptomyces purpurogeneiscleroticus]
MPATPTAASTQQLLVALAAAQPSGESDRVLLVFVVTVVGRAKLIDHQLAQLAELGLRFPRLATPLQVAIAGAMAYAAVIAPLLRQ